MKRNLHKGLIYDEQAFRKEGVMYKASAAWHPGCKNIAVRIHSENGMRVAKYVFAMAAVRSAQNKPVVVQVHIAVGQAKNLFNAIRNSDER